MPELPEVETVSRALRPHLLGRRILRTELYAERLRYPMQQAEFAPLAKQEIVRVHRRGRYCLIEMANQHVLVLHLGMTGKCRIVPQDTPRRPHEHIIWYLDDGQSWRFDDVRKFGIVEVHPIAAAGTPPASLAHLGPEPLGGAFTSEYLHQATRNRRGPIKTLIMDNAVVTGVGNIYASEACFRARIRPTTRAGRLSQARCDRLVRCIREVLADAIDAGGTTIVDFAGVDGSEGYFSRQLAVYGREGESCQRCQEGAIRRQVLSGRSTFHCPRCQH